MVAFQLCGGDFSKTAREAQLPLKFKNKIKKRGQISTVVLKLQCLKMH